MRRCTRLKEKPQVEPEPRVRVEAIRFGFYAECTIVETETRRALERKQAPFTVDCMVHFGHSTRSAHIERNLPAEISSLRQWDDSKTGSSFAPTKKNKINTWINACETQTRCKFKIVRVYFIQICFANNWLNSIQSETRTLVHTCAYYERIFISRFFFAFIYSTTTWCHGHNSQLPLENNTDFVQKEIKLLKSKQLKKYSQNVLVYTWILFLFLFLAGEIICFSIASLSPPLPFFLQQLFGLVALELGNVFESSRWKNMIMKMPRAPYSVPNPMLYGRWDAFTFKMCTISIRKFIYLISGACLINIYTALWRSYIDCYLLSSHSSYAPLHSV